MKLIELIPQVFYDAIGRIASGLILLATAGAIWYPELSNFLSDLAAQHHVTAGGSFLTLLLMAYAIAFTVEGIDNELEAIANRLSAARRQFLDTKSSSEEERADETPDDVSWPMRMSRENRQKKVWSEAWGEFCQAYKIGVVKAPPRPEDAIAIDVIRLLNAGAGARIVKLRAEKAFCRTLKVGWRSLLIVAILSWKAGGIAPDWLCLSSHLVFAVVVALLLAVRAIGARYDGIEDRHLHALYNHWLLLVDPGAPGLCQETPTMRSIAVREPPALLVSLDSVRDDARLLEKGVGSRKLLVTDLYESTERPATRLRWHPPGQGEKCHVLETTDIEASTFSELAPQDRHLHILATEIYLVLTGQMMIEVDGEPRTVHHGDMIVINPGTPHEVLKTDKHFLCRVITANCHGRRDKYIVPREKS